MFPHSADAFLPARHLPAIGLALTDATPEAAIRALLAPGRRRAYFVNAHCVNVRDRDPDYAAALERADILLPDGAGIEIAGRLTGDRLAANLNGTDLVPALLAEAARRGRRVFLLGARPGVAERAAARMAERLPGLRIAGTRDGYRGMSNPAELIAAINASEADIVLVAMGVPLQELWIDSFAHRLDAALCLGVGGAFDFLAGDVPRAPRPLRAARLEWAWRLAQEPLRLADRYLRGNPLFLARAVLRARAARRATRPAAHGGLPSARRCLHFILALLATVAVMPVFAVIATAIRLDSPGPVFFVQTRVGRGGRLFRMYKFRSMHVDAEARRAALLARSDREGVCFKSRKDPRVTRVGRWLRRFSIDELPQVLNVVKGDMALVGPRPALPEEVQAYPRRAHRRHAVRPGITGIWQVSGRAEIGFDRMIEMDLSYVARRSLWLDLSLMALTVRAVLGGRGAY